MNLTHIVLFQRRTAAVVVFLLFLGVTTLDAQPAGKDIQAAAGPTTPGKGVLQDARKYLLDAKRGFEEIRSYKCKATNVVMEYGILRNTRHYNTVLYSFEKPDRVRMTWLAPFLLQGQVAIYRDEELMVKLKFMPFFIKMDPNGMLAQDPAGNRIYDTHLGHVIEELLKAAQQDSQVQVVDAKIQAVNDAEINIAKDLLVLEIKNKEGKIVVFLDRRNFLPAYLEYYMADGKLEEACYFEDMVLNAKFESEEFEIDKASKEKLSDKQG